jgi:hypothetical protein
LDWSCKRVEFALTIKQVTCAFVRTYQSKKLKIILFLKYLRVNDKIRLWYYYCYYFDEILSYPEILFFIDGVIFLYGMLLTYLKYYVIMEYVKLVYLIYIFMDYCYVGWYLNYYIKLNDVWKVNFLWGNNDMKFILRYGMVLKLVFCYAFVYYPCFGKLHILLLKYMKFERVC